MPENMKTFRVDGDPKGQPRPRAWAKKIGDKYQARVYDAGTADGWKGLVALAAKPHIPESPIMAPVSVSLVFHFRRPKSHYRGGGAKKESAPCWHTGRPDADNLAKAVLDVMTGLGFWGDDGQVYDLGVTKGYSERPGCAVVVRWQS